MNTSNDTWSTSEGVRQLADEVGRDPVALVLQQVHLYRDALRETRTALEVANKQLRVYETF